MASKPIKPTPKAPKGKVPAKAPAKASPEIAKAKPAPKGQPGRKKGTVDRKTIAMNAFRAAQRGEEGPAEANSRGKSHAGAKAGGRAVLVVAPELDLDATKLPLRWQIFIEEYLIDMSGKYAAIRAGFAPTDAAQRACKLLARPVIAAIVQARIDERIEAIRMTRDRVLDAFADIAEADANELSEHRRVACRHCHGAYDATTGARARQLTPSEWVKKRDAWEERRADGKVAKKRDIGPFKEEAGDWFDKRLPINPECNECFGDGISEVHLKDTRNISRRARSIYAGTKEGKDGIEIKTYSKEGALGVLAKHHKLYDEAPTINVTSVSSDTLNAIYAKGVADSDAAKTKMIGRGDRVRALAPPSHG